MGALYFCRYFLFCSILLSSAANASSAIAPETSTLHQQASFDCKSASSTTEKLICSDEVLSGKDNELAKLWQSTLDSYSGSQRISLVSGERNWLKLRIKACQIDANKDKAYDYTACLISVYDQRLKMLAELREIHKKFSDVDFDQILDKHLNLSDYDPAKIGGMYLKSGSDIDYTTSYVPLTCRELYTLNSGSWDYSHDTIGINGGSFAKSQCAFAVISELSHNNLPVNTESILSKALNKAVGFIQDEAEFHTITKVKFGDFTNQKRKEVLAIVFSHDTGTLHFNRLYCGYYDDSKKEFILNRFNEDSPLNVECFNEQE